MVLNICIMDFVEFVIGSFSCFNIVIAYSNFEHFLWCLNSQFL